MGAYTYRCGAAAASASAGLHHEFVNRNFIMVRAEQERLSMRSAKKRCFRPMFYRLLQAQLARTSALRSHR